MSENYPGSFEDITANLGDVQSRFMEIHFEDIVEKNALDSEPIFGSARAFLEGHPRKYVDDDARTMLFEVLTESGHISVVESKWDPERETFVAYINDDGEGLSLREMYERSLTMPNLHPREFARRQAELHEELFVEQLYRSGQLKNRAILTLSAFPEGLDDRTAANLGYRPQNLKYMLRWHEVDEHGNRKLSQLSMSNSNLKTLNELYGALGYDTGGTFNDVDFLKQSILVEKDQVGSVVEIAQMIDTMRGRGEVFGETGRSSIAYERVIEESKLREERAEQEIKNFADQMIAIEASGLDFKSKLKAYKQALDRSRAVIVMDQPELGGLVGEESAEFLARARQYIEEGNEHMAMQMFNRGIDVMEESPACGGGLASDEDVDNTDPLAALNRIINGRDTEEEERYSFNKMAHCRTCDPHREKEMVKCGPCNICKDCDGAIRSGIPTIILSSSREGDANFMDVMLGALDQEDDGLIQLLSISSEVEVELIETSSDDPELEPV